MILMSSPTLIDFYVGRHSRPPYIHNSMLARFYKTWGLESNLVLALALPNGILSNERREEYLTGWFDIYVRIKQSNPGLKLDSPDVIPPILIKQNKTASFCCYKNTKTI